MKILVYDDNIDDIKQLENCITNFFNKINEEYKIVYCQTQKELFSLKATKIAKEHF